MCSTPKVKAPEPVAPPPPPAPSATELEQPGAVKKKRGEASALDQLRIPLNPTGMARTPRIGL